MGSVVIMRAGLSQSGCTSCAVKHRHSGDADTVSLDDFTRGGRGDAGHMQADILTWVYCTICSGVAESVTVPAARRLALA